MNALCALQPAQSHELPTVMNFRLSYKKSNRKIKATSAALLLKREPEIAFVLKALSTKLRSAASLTARRQRFRSKQSDVDSRVQRSNLRALKKYQRE